MVVRSMEIKKKRKMLWFELKKESMKGEKHITPMEFSEYLRKLDVSENNKQKQSPGGVL